MAKLKEILFLTYNQSSVKETLDILKQTLKTNTINPQSVLDKNTKLIKRKDKLLEMLLDEVITKDEYTEKKNELENQIKKNNEQYEKLLAKSKNQVSAEDRLKEIEKFLSADFKSSDDIDDETVANIVDKIIVNDDTLDVYLKNGDKDFSIPIGNNKSFLRGQKFNIFQ